MTPTHIFASSLIPPQTGSVAFNGLPVTHGGSGKTQNEWENNPWPRASASFVGSAYDAVFLALHVEAKLISAPGSHGGEMWSSWQSFVATENHDSMTCL